MARSGASVEFIGAVGDDDFGSVALSNLREAGIEISRCATIPDAHSGVAMITLDAHAENTIIIAPGANEHLRPHFLDGICWSEYDAVVLQLEICLDTVWQVLRDASPHTTIFLTPAPVRPVPSELLGCVDYLIPNEHEILPLAPNTETLECAARAVAGQVRLGVALTLGAQGIRWFGCDGEENSIPAPRVIPVDTVGAGDCFTGYFVHGIGTGMSLQAAAARACRAAALQVTRLGAQTAIPFAHEVE